MHTITFDFLGQYRHGSAFHEYLRLRKSFFVDELGWDIPHNDDVEMDQYDNPCAHYSLVMRNGKVVGGARIMPTTAVWGRHSYMLRDALHGCIEQIPRGACRPTSSLQRGLGVHAAGHLRPRQPARRSAPTAFSLIVEGLSISPTAMAGWS